MARRPGGHCGGHGSRSPEGAGRTPLGRPGPGGGGLAGGFGAVSSDWMRDLIRLVAIGGGGAAASYKIMALLGRPVVNHGLAIDEPLFRWTEDHQVDWWAAPMGRLNTVGNVWTTWGGVGAAAACLGVSWRQQRWLPPATLGAALLADHFATTRLHRTIRRPGPPLIRWVHIRRVAPTGSSCSPA